MSDTDKVPSGRTKRAAGVARHGRLSRPKPWLAALQIIGVSVLVIAVSAGSVAAIEFNRLVGQTPEINLPSADGDAPPNIAAYDGGFNILIVGSDTGEGQGDLGEGRGSAALNDVNILLHVAADHSNAVAVSFPRDLVVPIPSCTNPKTGRTSAAMAAQPINVALSYGGVECVAATVEKFTGLTVDFAGSITFRGVVEMSTAVGGVPVCLATDIADKWTGFYREAGTHTLEGYEALAFLRSRHGVGDGSDLTRISSQQVFLGALVRTLKSNETLGDPAKVYAIANAALTNMTLSPNLKNLDMMAQIALALKDIPMESVTFVQYPGNTGQPGVYQGKVKPNTAVGNQLFAKIKADEPFALEKAGDNNGSTIDPNATPTTPDPTASGSPETVDLPVIAGLRGQTAADQTCSVGFLQGTG